MTDAIPRIAQICRGIDEAYQRTDPVALAGWFNESIVDQSTVRGTGDKITQHKELGALVVESTSNSKTKYLMNREMHAMQQAEPLPFEVKFEDDYPDGEDEFKGYHKKVNRSDLKWVWPTNSKSNPAFREINLGLSSMLSIIGGKLRIGNALLCVRQSAPMVTKYMDFDTMKIVTTNEPVELFVHDAGVRMMKYYYKEYGGETPFEQMSIARMQKDQVKRKPKTDAKSDSTDEATEQMVHDRGKADGIMDVKGQMELIDSEDTLFPKRALLLMNMVSIKFSNMEDDETSDLAFADDSKFDWYAYDGLADKVYRELLEYLFHMPDKRTNELSSKTNKLRSMMFALARTGKSVQYLYAEIVPDPGYGYTITGWSEKDIATAGTDGGVFNDEAAYEGMSSEIDDELNGLKDLGLKWTAYLFQILRGPELSRWHLKMRVWLVACLAAPGFTRTEAGISHNETVEGETPPDSVPFGDRIRRLCKFMVEWAHANNRIPTKEEYLRSLPSSLKNTSAGATVDGIPDSSSAVFEFQGKLMKFESLDKVMRFMLNTKFYTDGDTIRKSNMLTVENPGRAGSREVVKGKKKRPIMMMPLEHYLCSVVISRIMSDFQMAKFRDTPGNYKWNGSIQYSVGEETGVIMQTHAISAIASSEADQIAFATDFEAFDSTEYYETTFKYGHQGFKEGAAACGLSNYVFMDSEDGPPLTFDEMIDEVIGPKHISDMHFKSEGAYFEQWSTIDLPNGMMASGKLYTLTFNNVVNEADMEILIEAIEAHPKLQGKLKLKSVRMMGDDRQIILTATSEGQMTKEIYTTLREVAAEVAVSNGLKMQPSKVGCRRAMSEYLKKEFMYGYYIPLMHVQLHDAERSDQREDPVEQIRSYDSLLQTYTWRGCNLKFAEKMLMAYWNMKRNVRIPDREDAKARKAKGDLTRTRRSLYLPFEALFLPTYWDGIGHVLKVPFLASRDAYITYTMGEEPDKMERYSNIAKIMYGTLRSDVSELVAAMADATTVKGTGSMQEFRDYIDEHRDEMKHLNAGRAAERLAARGFPNIARSFDYRDQAIRVQKKSLESTSIAKRMVYAQREMMGTRAMENLNKYSRMSAPAIPVEHVWMTYIKFVPNEAYHPVVPVSTCSITPFDCLCHEYIAITRAVGVTSDGGIPTLTLRTLVAKLFADPTFPRDINAEAVAKLLFPIIHDEELCLDALIRIGAEPTHASNIVNEIRSHRALYMATISAMAMGSYADNFLPNLDLSEATVMRICPENAIIPWRSPAYAMLSTVIIAKFIGDFMTTGTFTSYVLTERNTLLRSALFKIIYGRDEPILSFIADKSIFDTSGLDQYKDADLIKRIKAQQDALRETGATIVNSSYDPGFGAFGSYGELNFTNKLTNDPELFNQKI
jgi:hypothetical protein